jgi:hypothetical protein
MASEEYQQQPEVNEISETGEQESLSKTQTTEVLEKTIEQLKAIVAQLDTEEIKDLPNKAAIDSLVTTTEELAAAFTSTQQTASLEVTPEIVEDTTEIEVSTLTSSSSIPNTETQSVSEEKVKEQDITPETNLKKSNTWWNKVLDKIRSQWILTSLVTVALLIIIVFASINIFPEKTTQIEIAENNLPVVEEPVNLPQTTISLEEEKPSTLSEKLPISEENKSIAVEEPTETIVNPPELIAPGKPKSIKVENAPSKIKLTPEQNLVATLQTQVGGISKQYPQELVLSIEPDFWHSYLLVKVSDNWYGLNQSLQNKLASDMLKGSQQLNFHKLKIVDLEGTLVARNPVVGNEMVIFQREKENMNTIN